MAGRSWSVPLGIVGVLMAGFCAFFFRDFNRHTPPDAFAIYSPGDGRVLDVAIEPDGELKGWTLIRIFLSVFDVHVQRSPVEGKVSKVEHKPGTFLDARHARAHLDNEQNTVVIDSPKGRVFVKQIAGLIARRIVCWTKEGATLKQGERYGLIRFGSQVDVLMPSNVEVAVKTGERVMGGVTVLARWRS